MIHILTFNDLGKRKRILIAPLDWGLGHAARCVPIINDLKADFDLILAGSGRVKHFLKQAFPKLQFVDFEGYNITYPDKGNMALKMLLQMPRVLARIKEEQKELQDIIRDYQIDLVISDNRFGLYSDLVPSVYITHQIHIQAPGIVENGLFKLHGKYIKRFDRCWIPDIEGGNNLSGELGHGVLPGNCQYIGPLSRLTQVDTAKQYDYCALISGPEPQRSKFEELVIGAFESRKESLLVLSGKPEDNGTGNRGNIEIINHQQDIDLARSICSSGAVIARPGYSSLMDLAKLGVGCVFVPTPGQTEQEYLASYHHEKNGIPFLRQKDFSYDNLSQLQSKSLKFPAANTSFVNLLKELF